MPKTLSKSDLVGAMAKAAAIPKTKADTALDALVDTVVSNVTKGNTVRVTGLGTWKRQPRKARTARNPQTGASVKVPATKVPKFTPAVGFKDEVGGNSSGKKKKTTARKPAARKTTARKPAARKPAARKPATRKPAARKPAARKPAARKPAARRTSTRRPAARRR